MIYLSKLTFLKTFQLTHIIEWWNRKGNFNSD